MRKLRFTITGTDGNEYYYEGEVAERAKDAFEEALAFGQLTMVFKTNRGICRFFMGQIITTFEEVITQ